MSASQTDFIKFLVNDCIQGIEEDLIRHYDETHNPILGYCGGGNPVYLTDLRFEEKREWLTNKACGKNNKDRLKFVKLCNSIKDRKLKELMSHCIKLDKQNTKYLEKFALFTEFLLNKTDKETMLVKLEKYKEFWEDPTKEVEGETILLKN